MTQERSRGRLVEFFVRDGVARAELDDGRQVVVGGRSPLWDSPCTDVVVSKIEPADMDPISAQLWGLDEGDPFMGAVEPADATSSVFLGRILTYESDDGPGWIVLACGHYVRFPRLPTGSVPMKIGSLVEVRGLTPFTGSTPADWKGAKFHAESLRALPPPKPVRTLLPSALSADERRRLEAQLSETWRLREIDVGRLAARAKWPGTKKHLSGTLPLASKKHEKDFVESASLDPLFAPWRNEILKTWAPAYRLEADPASPLASHLGGATARLRSAWPRCAGCSNPLQLVAELVLGEMAALLPEEEGTLAVFFCFDCGAESERVEYAPAESKSKDREGEPAFPAIAFKANGIRTRPPASDLHGSPIDALFAARRYELRNGHFSETDGARLYDAAIAGKETRSQVGGFPVWIQDDDADCPSCRKPRQHIATFASDLGFELGDGGALYVLACRRKETCGWLARASVVFQCH